MPELLEKIILPIVLALITSGAIKIRWDISLKRLLLIFLFATIILLVIFYHFPVLGFSNGGTK